MSDIQALLSALDVFSRAPDRVSLEKANAWLQDFQHSPEAWTTCNILLRSPDAPLAAKLFAAQTFRSKVTYDLHQVDPDNLFSLRDTIIAALEHYKIGPRTILVQLCLALSGLALQMPTWSGAVEGLIESYGQDASMVPVLLQFLTLLPEELTGNTKIPVTDQDYKERAELLLTANASRVLDILSIYIRAPGVTHAVQSQIFACLRSWLVVGEISAVALADTALFEFCFEALASEQLFDAAVDVVCDLIHETQEIDDNMPVIERIVPKVIELRPKLAAAKDDPEQTRGYARIFTEAGETYRLLVLHHTETFFPIVEAIGECSAYSDLDIVPITFPFWMRLAQSIGKRATVSPLFHDAYNRLMAVIIEHLHFPADSSALVGQELDNFRSFRHVMGDTLKDCCYVLGTEQCLAATLQVINAALSLGPNATWQDVEAPLFGMRSMGAEVDPMDDNIVPKIMDLIPTLPAHPRIRYAALLIISRYTEWINLHSDYIPRSLQYISAGFEDTDAEVLGAAGQALKYLCQDCKQHLVPFLAQLHTFLATVGPKLPQEDKLVVYEAIAHVISAMPMEQAAQSLRTFALDILAAVAAVANRTVPATKQELQDIGHGLANLEVMLHVVGGFGEELPAACQSTCEETWSMFETFITKYGSDYETTEHVTRVLRHGLNLFGNAALGVAPAVLLRMAASFKMTGLSSYLWIASKIQSRFGNEEDTILRTAFRVVYEESTEKLSTLLQEKSPSHIPDVLEDYMRMLLQMVDYSPDIFFESLAFPIAFRIALAGLTLIQSEIVFVSLDLIRIILNHDCLEPPANAPPPPKFPIYANAIRGVIDAEGFELTGLLLAGLVGDFPEEASSSIISIFRVLASQWSTQLVAWTPPVLQQLPSSVAPDDAKALFLKEITDSITMGQYDKVKYAVLGIHRTSRKIRERRRVTPLD
ncbi:ARM repeat-containing protein [Auriscalpium vulgare]|uniref:ARM repeat-containing protein n=1 Tax=Auriscalpium vulgare TaxID=40419 RepID=A0ACB8SC00_9AGAM|nr:ARM repeat-containing protein [Auriscalpium vulgare]